MRVAHFTASATFVFLGFYLFAAVYPASHVMGWMWLFLVAVGAGWGSLLVRVLDVEP